MRHTAIAATLAAVLALTACSGDGEPVTPDEGETSSPAPTASGSDPQGDGPTAEDETDDVTLADLTISTRGIGPFEVGMSVAALSELTAIDYSTMVDGSAECVEFPLSYADPLSSMAALTETGGLDGTVDTFAVFDWQSEGFPTPRTDDGLGLGSSLDEITAVYADTLQTAPWTFDDDVTRAWTAGDDGYGIQFLVDAVSGAREIVVGRVPQVTYEAGCP